MMTDGNEAVERDSTESTAIVPALLNPTLQAAFRCCSLAVIVTVALLAIWQYDPAERNAQDRRDTGFRINLNTASDRELTLMPGIGMITAERILRDRNANGPFDSLNDLQRVPGIGPKTVQAIAPYCEVLEDGEYRPDRLIAER